MLPTPSCLCLPAHQTILSNPATPLMFAPKFTSSNCGHVPVQAGNAYEPSYGRVWLVWALCYATMPCTIWCAALYRTVLHHSLVYHGDHKVQCWSTGVHWSPASGAVLEPGLPWGLYYGLCSVV